MNIRPPEERRPSLEKIKYGRFSSFPKIKEEILWTLSKIILLATNQNRHPRSPGQSGIVFTIDFHPHGHICPIYSAFLAL